MINELTKATVGGELLSTQVTDETFSGVLPAVFTKRLARCKLLVTARATIRLWLCTSTKCHLNWKHMSTKICKHFSTSKVPLSLGSSWQPQQRPLMNAYEFNSHSISLRPYCTVPTRTVPMGINLPPYSTYMQSFNFRSTVIPEISVYEEKH